MISTNRMETNFFTLRGKVWWRPKKSTTAETFVKKLIASHVYHVKLILSLQTMSSLFWDQLKRIMVCFSNEWFFLQQQKIAFMNSSPKTFRNPKSLCFRGIFTSNVLLFDIIAQTKTCFGNIQRSTQPEAAAFPQVSKNLWTVNSMFFGVFRHYSIYHLSRFPLLVCTLTSDRRCMAHQWNCSTKIDLKLSLHFLEKFFSPIHSAGENVRIWNFLNFHLTLPLKSSVFCALKRASSSFCALSTCSSSSASVRFMYLISIAWCVTSSKS